MTPPIKGFNPRDYMGSGDEEDEEESTSPVISAEASKA
jgi:hypothetical protein